VIELRGPSYQASRVILIVAAVAGCAVLIGLILLFLSPAKPLPCNRTLVHVDSLYPPKNEEQRRFREKPHYRESGPGCP